MKLFLSYPSAERTTAERLVLALEAEGHEVFFDRSDLAPATPFHRPLRDAIQTADAMVFLVTPASVAPGSYALSELDIAREHWRRPAGHVLPVMLAPTPIASMPPYLAAVTMLEPKGELVAETVAAVARLGSGRGVRKRRISLAVMLALAALAAGTGVTWLASQQRAVEAALSRDRAAAAAALQVCFDGSHELALARLAELAAHDPAAPEATRLAEDCAMRWMREMRATSIDGTVKRSFDEQVAVIEPVLLRGLADAPGARGADLRAHIGWGAYLRLQEGAGGDPVPYWQSALGDDPENVYAHGMWGNVLLRTSNVAEARSHLARAVASGRDREYVRSLQLGGSLGGDDEAAVYAITVVDDMRRHGETLSVNDRQRLWSYAFSRLVDPAARDALFAEVAPAEALATFDWLFAGGDIESVKGPQGRFTRTMLQAHAGQPEAARAGFEALLSEDRRASFMDYRLRDAIKRELAALER